MITNEEAQRYARQLMLQEIGTAGQDKLKQARVLIIGAGGLGSPAAMNLAGAGVGVLGICDGDTVDYSNLQRQFLHTTERIGQKKTDSARLALGALNPNVQIVTHEGFAHADTIQQLIEPYDFILDCTDAFAAKFMINDACVLAGKPFCHAGILHFGGQLMTWLPSRGLPCYRCIFRDAPPAAAGEKGVIGPAAGVAGSLQAMEAIKFITGAGTLLAGKLLTFDLLGGEFRTIALPARASDCPACSR